jgi:hypothetical protein
MLLTAVLLLVGCAHLAGPGTASKATLVVSDDGRTVTAGGETWTAPAGVSFYQRGSVLRVVYAAPGRSWDVAVIVGPEGKLAWPEDAPFQAASGALTVRASAGQSSEVEQLIASGQLYPHDDHFHLTHLLQNEDWQALYRAREEGSPLPPIRRQVAATVLAMLVDMRLSGKTPEATTKALARMTSIIGKVRRGVEGDVPAPAIESMALYDFELRDAGRTMALEGRTYRAGKGLRFAYCGSHIHVEGADGKWAQPVDLEPGPNGELVWPASIFFSAAPDGTVSERPASTRARKLIDGGQIRFSREHWHVTEGYQNPRLQYVLKVIEDPKAPTSIKDRARGAALELMRLRLDTGTEAEFDARLEAIDQAIDRTAAELEKELRAAGTRR